MQGADLAAILDMGPIEPAALALLSKAQRQRAQAGIDALLDYLDALTPDADLEPSLGANEPGWTCGTQWAQLANGIDLEAVDEDGDDLDRGERDTSDYEPALGVPEGSPDLPGCWAQKSRSAFDDEDWETDWKNERDEREILSHCESMRHMEAA